jgi:hypothetical protein
MRRRAERTSGVNETYMEAGRRGKNTWWRYVLGIVFIVFMWFVVGGWASLALANLLGISPEQIATNTSAAGPIAGYLIIIAPTPCSGSDPCSPLRYFTGGGPSRWVSPAERSLPETSGGSRDRI